MRTDPMHAQPAPITPIMRCAAFPRPFSRNSAYTMMTAIAAAASPIPEYTHERSMLHSRMTTGTSPHENSEQYTQAR